MPAAPSSLTDPVIGQLLPAAQALGSDLMRLLPVLASVPDPRARRGVRHKLAVILDLAVCAVLAGADPHDSPACPLSFGTIGCELRSSHTPAPFDEGRRPGSVPRTGGSHVRVVRRVDHVPVYVSDPHILFNVLTERLGLPAGMPVTRLPGFQSGVVVLGNVGLEVIRPAPGRRVGVPLDQGSFGIALEPEPLEAAVAELDRRSIPHLPPFPTRRRHRRADCSPSIRSPSRPGLRPLSAGSWATASRGVPRGCPRLSRGGLLGCWSGSGGIWWPTGSSSRRP